MVAADRSIDPAVLERSLSALVRMTLDGELDLASGGPLQARLRALQRAHATITLELSPLSFIDCAGLQVLVEA